ncbi:MAG: roadblock/LC7 domain-containing protein [Deltaproteobacteria bacterium]|nr:roadblock/LC7 domain-containing protein [Candidatus Zymogenaceae bacterium]
MTTYKVEKLTQIISELHTGISGVDAVVLETYEGLVLASTLPTSLEEEIIAAVSSNTQSVVNRAVREIKHGKNHNTLIINSDGQIILTDIDGKALLTVIAKRTANLGLISIMSRRVADDLKEVLPF